MSYLIEGHSLSNTNFPNLLCTKSNLVHTDVFKSIQEIGAYNGKTLFSLSPILIKVVFEKDYCLAENDDYNVYASGENQESAISDFKDLIISLYCHYQNSSETNITPCSLKEKTKFLNDFKLV